MTENWILARKKSVGLYSLVLWDTRSTAVISAIFVPQQWRDLQQYHSVRKSSVVIVLRYTTNAFDGAIESQFGRCICHLSATTKL